MASHTFNQYCCQPIEILAPLARFFLMCIRSGINASNNAALMQVKAGDARLYRFIL